MSSRTADAAPNLDGDFEPESRVDWEQAVREAMHDGRTLNEIAHTTIDGLSIDPLYSERPAFGSHFGSILNRPCGNRIRCVSARDVEATAERLKTGLANGYDTIELAMEGSGLPAATLKPEQLLTLLDGIDLCNTPLLLRNGAAENGLDTALKELSGRAGGSLAGLHVGVDPLGARLKGRNGGAPLRAALIESAPFMREIDWLPVAEGGEWTVFSVDAVVHHNAGASEVQELVAAIATAALYLDVLHEAGVAPARVAATLSFHMACDADLVMNVVKLRSLALLWQHLQRSIGIDPAPLRLHVHTSRRQIVRREPWINHLRNTSAAMAALFGNASSLLVHPHTLGLDVDDAERTLAERLARNIAVMLRHESHLGAVRDPFAGAYAIESLCDAMCHQTWKYLEQLERDGGWLVALAGDRWRGALTRAQAERESRLQSGEAVALGVNRIVDGELISLSSSVEDGLTWSNDNQLEVESHIRPLPRVRVASRFESQAPAAEEHEA